MMGYEARRAEKENCCLRADPLLKNIGLRSVRHRVSVQLVAVDRPSAA